MVELEAGSLSSANFMDISCLKSLRYIKTVADYFEIGALTTYKDLMTHYLVKKELQLLVRASEETAAPAIQTRGTVGGNIANASPAADTPPVLLVYDAKVFLQSKRGQREVPYRNFHTGYKTLDKSADELIVALKVPRRPSSDYSWYHKVGTRRMQAISKVVFSGVSRMEKGKYVDVRLAFGSVAATPIRATFAEDYILGKKQAEVDRRELAKELYRSVTPLDDVRSTKEYRELIALNLVELFLADSAKQ